MPLASTGEDGSPEVEPLNASVRVDTFETEIAVSNALNPVCPGFPR